MQAIENILSRNSISKLEGPPPSREEMDIVYKSALRAPDHRWLRPSEFIEVTGDGLNKLSKIFETFSNDNIKDINLVRNSQNISKRIFYPYKPLFVEIIFVLFRFLGFLCCINAFSIGSLISQGELISSFSLAWIIGLIVPAAPGGLGVFESVILFGLSSHLPEAPLLASLLCYRLVSTVSDILASLIYPVKNLFKV